MKKKVISFIIAFVIIFCSLGQPAYAQEQKDYYLSRGGSLEIKGSTKERMSVAVITEQDINAELILYLKSSDNIHENLMRASFYIQSFQYDDEMEDYVYYEDWQRMIRPNGSAAIKVDILLLKGRTEFDLNFTDYYNKPINWTVDYEIRINDSDTYVTSMAVLKSADISPKKTKNLITSKSPENGKELITWTTSDPKVVTVDHNGTITGVANGKAVVKAKLHNGKTYQTAVTVQNPKISETRVYLTKGRGKNLKVSGNVDKVSFTSSNEKIVSVTSSGKITAKSKGTAVITAVVGSRTLKCTVTTEIPKISKTYASLRSGKKLKLKLGGTKQKVRWSTSNKSVATVNQNGEVSAKKKGKTTITAVAGGIKYHCKVAVK